MEPCKCSTTTPNPSQCVTFLSIPPPPNPVRFSLSAVDDAERHVLTRCIVVWCARQCALVCKWRYMICTLWRNIFVNKALVRYMCCQRCAVVVVPFFWLFRCPSCWECSCVWDFIISVHVAVLSVAFLVRFMEVWAGYKRRFRIWCFNIWDRMYVACYTVLREYYSY